MRQSLPLKTVYYTWLNILDKDKYSSLFTQGITDEEKRFATTKTGVNVLKLLLLFAEDAASKLVFFQASLMFVRNARANPSRDPNV